MPSHHKSHRIVSHHITSHCITSHRTVSFHRMNRERTGRKTYDFKHRHANNKVINYKFIYKTHNLSKHHVHVRWQDRDINRIWNDFRVWAKLKSIRDVVCWLLTDALSDVAWHGMAWHEDVRLLIATLLSQCIIHNNKYPNIQAFNESSWGLWVCSSVLSDEIHLKYLQCTKCHGAIVDGKKTTLKSPYIHTYITLEREKKNIFFFLISRMAERLR